MSGSVAFSAPGKALIAGGYLVLYPEFFAYTIALSSRMHAVYTPNSEQTLIVESPQFLSKWIYDLPSGKAVEQPHPNPFIAAVAQTFSAYFGDNIKGAKITIWSDQGFHSQPPGASSRFTMHETHITNVPKTGLGSSAALTVVVVAALLRAQQGFTDLQEKDLQIIHNLAQVAHSLSQGKVGSGFDVATAVYGSIKYSRFPPDLIDMDLTHVKGTCDKKWQMETDRVRLPASVKILMGDVQNGSETPSMVRKILEWRKTDPTAADLWEKLGKANLRLTQVLNEESLAEIPAAIRAIRAQLQEMTRLADVPVEPAQQTQLLDRCSDIEGVLGGVVPGAGGSDAICLLVETSKIELVKRELSKIEGVHWLPLEQENDGLRIEDVSIYSH